MAHLPLLQMSAAIQTARVLIAPFQTQPQHLTTIRKEPSEPFSPVSPLLLHHEPQHLDYHFLTIQHHLNTFKARIPRFPATDWQARSRIQTAQMPLILDSPPPSPPNERVDIDSREERRRLHHDADVVIVGAGILGCAMAVALGNQGRSVLLLERSLKEPDRIVGELLQPGGVRALQKLGLSHCLEDIDSIPVAGYDVIYHGEEVEILYPMNAARLQGQEKRKRPEGRSFHHGRFIRQLRASAMKAPNVTVVETTVNEVIKNDYTGQIVGVEATTRGEKDFFFGDLTIICDGYASKFRKDYITKAPVSKSKFYGLELIDADLPMPNHGHVILGNNAPTLLYQIGTHETRALIDIREGTATASLAAGGVKNHLKEVVLPTLPASVQPSFAAAIEKGNIRSMPNSWLPPTVNKTAGMILLGDALNMRHPLTGGGMTVALTDVVLLSELLAPSRVPYLNDTKAVLAAMKTFHWRRKNISSTINILAQALYALFAADSKYLKALQMGCFRYFQIGGNCVDGPVGLLAGIIENPLVLFSHFFAVAFYAIWIMAMNGNPVMVPYVFLVEGPLIFLTAVQVIGPYIFSEMRR